MGWSGSEKFEFVFYINNNIVCQRFFNVNRFNKKVLKSMDLKYLIDRISDIIENDFKRKSEKYLWNFYNPYEPQLEEEIERINVYENEDKFLFEIKVDKRVVISKEFTGNHYPPKVRYDINIRNLVSPIISEIQEVFESTELETEYLGIKL